jgi:hypothetical protein
MINLLDISVVPNSINAHFVEDSMSILETFGSTGKWDIFLPNDVTTPSLSIAPSKCNSTKAFKNETYDEL